MATSGAQPGNSNAAKGKAVRDALRAAIARSGAGDFDKGLAKICDKVVALAESGEQWAAQEVFNRFDGRVPSAVELTGANGGDLVIRDAVTSLGVARRVAYALAMGALAKAQSQAKDSEASDATHQEG